jgi:hypothetical protein
MSNHPRLIYAGGEIPAGSDGLVWWSTDSKTLFYRHSGEVWQYAISTGVSVLAEGESFSTPTPPLELRALIPPEAVEWRISPSGGLILYFVPVGPATPTAQPSATEEVVDGERWEDGGNVELWALSDGDKRKLGEIAWCVQDDIWSGDEKQVVLTSIGPPATCLQFYALLIDFDVMKIQALFPAEEHALVNIGDFSPDNRQLLYVEMLYSGEAIWNSLDLVTLDSQKIRLPPVSSPQWINNQNLFVEFKREDVNSWAFGIYRVEKSMLDEVLIFASYPDLRGRYPIVPVISPDRQWVAFAVGESMYNAESIWVMKLADFIDRLSLESIIETQ